MSGGGPIAGLAGVANSNRADPDGSGADPDGCGRRPQELGRLTAVGSGAEPADGLRRSARPASPGMAPAIGVVAGSSEGASAVGATR